MVNLRVCLFLCIPLLCASAVWGEITVGYGYLARLMLKVKEKLAKRYPDLEMT